MSADIAAGLDKLGAELATWPGAHEVVDYAVVRALHRRVSDELTARLREQSDPNPEHRRAEGERVALRVVTDWVDGQRRQREVGQVEEDAMVDAVLAELVGLGRLQALLDDPRI